MPKKYKTQETAEAQMRRILLETQLLSLAEKAWKDGDSLNLFALMKALEKLISILWVKSFYFLDCKDGQELRLKKRMCENLRELVQLLEDMENNRFKLGDSYRMTLLAVAKLLEENGVSLNEINEIIYGAEEVPPAGVVNH